MKDFKPLAGFGLAGTAIAWPALSCVLRDLAASPYEMALASAWCGGAPHAVWDIAGHAPVCWAGAAMIGAAAATLIAPAAPRAIGRYSRRR